jgi:multiple antibiotic resistance protein
MDLRGVGNLPLSEMLALLFLGMGPVRITMSYLPYSKALPVDVQRTLAWRTVLAGFVVAVAIMLVGAGTVNNFGLNAVLLQLAAGVAFFIMTVPSLLSPPSDAAPPAQISHPLRLAISPLAVPTMITPVGIAVLFAVAAFTPGVNEQLMVVGLVAAVLAINLVVMLLCRRLAPYLTRPVLEVLQKVFGLVVLGFSLRLVLQALAALGVIPALSL